jgi:AraC-like DNA-binding protein
MNEILQKIKEFSSRHDIPIFGICRSSQLENAAPPAEAAEALADRVVAMHECDGARDVAEAYPLSVFPDALGMTPYGRECLLPYGNFVFNSMGPRNALLEASLAELARIANFSPFHFHRLFRAMTGESAAGLVRRLRLVAWFALPARKKLLSRRRLSRQRQSLYPKIA